MRLSLIYAAIVPVATFALAASAWQLIEWVSSPKKSTAIANSDLMIIPFVAFFAALVAGITVLPNLGATFAANRFCAASTGKYFAVLSSGSVLGMLVMAALVNSIFRSDSAIDFNDWRTYAAIGANAGILCLTALLFGSRHD
jgi:hypothetical protein